MLNYPNIDPIIFSIGPLQLRWYGLSYVCGLLVAFKYLDHDFKVRLKLNSDQVLSVMTSIIVGVLVGGRLGYIFFYDLLFYLDNPVEMLAFWHGGMSYHGAAIGAMCGMLYSAKKFKLSPFKLLDLLGIGSCIGIGFGRIANFINGELYGRVTDSFFGMVFPRGGDLPRHPSQLYEAFLEGFVLFLILHIVKTKCDVKDGVLFVLYLIGYGFFRFVLEFFRQPDAQLGTLFMGFSMGQLLCVVMISLGAGLYQVVRR